MIRAENIHKSFGKLHVLKGVHLEIATGELVSIMGASGAGKSTLLHIIGTLDKPDAGTIVFDEQPVRSFSDKQLADFRNRNIGFVFQFHQLLPEFTAFENVCIPGYIARRNAREVKSRAMELLEYLGLRERLTHKPAALSGGEQQRVAVARALINNPKVILADEPSGNLDTQNAEELHALFFRLRREFNQTFVIVTHNEDLAKLADRQLHIRDGVILS